MGAANAHPVRTISRREFIKTAPPLDRYLEFFYQEAPAVIQKTVSIILEHLAPRKYANLHEEEYVPLYEAAYEEYERSEFKKIREHTGDIHTGLTDLHQDLMAQQRRAKYWKMISVLISVLSLAIGLMSVI
jgi:hypothetical protein